MSSQLRSLLLTRALSPTSGVHHRLPNGSGLCAVCRVARNFLRRMAAPAVMVMHNGSSYHALPALLSDLHEAQGALYSNSSRARAGDWLKSAVGSRVYVDRLHLIRYIAWWISRA